MNPTPLLVLVVLLLLGCSDDASTSDSNATPSNTASDASQSDAGDDTNAAPEDTGAEPDSPPEPTPVADRSPGPLERWASPIDDYLEVGRMEAGEGGSFLMGIHDLAVYEDRLYLGYGDANINLGRVTPIEFRYIDSIDAGAEAISEFASDEEQLDRYRLIDGTLYMAGIDATEDAWLGNVYVREAGDAWVKSRTLSGGVHVHDVMGFQGALWAVGSGATPEEWSAGDIYAHLWRSDDGGASFTIAERAHNGGTGDMRWVHLLTVGDRLHMFGYGSNAQGQIDELNHRRTDGATLEPLPNGHPLRFVFVEDTWRVGEQGLVTGVDASADPLLNGAWLMRTSDDVVAVEALAEVTTRDVAPVMETGEWLVLVTEGNVYLEAPADGIWRTRVLVTRDFESFSEWLTVESEELFVSMAWWRDGLVLGSEAGALWRAAAP